MAVLMVVAYHSGLGGGFVGVDVFFVVSGFLMTGLLMQGEPVTRFYARRAVRLLPAACTMIVATLVAAWAWLPAGRFGDAATDALASTFYTMNVRLALAGSDYLAAEATASPFMHFWSLGVEEQFYILWPLVLLLFVRSGRLVLPLALLTAASFALSIWQTTEHAPAAYYGLHTRLWELTAGALVAVTAPRWKRLPPRSASLLRWLGLTGIITASTIFTSQTPFPGYAAALPVTAAALVIGAGCAHPHSRTLSLPPLQWLGKLSYSWYLWHWPVLFFASVLLGELSRWQTLGFAALALALAAVTYFAIENPLRRSGSLRLVPARGVGLGLGLCALAATFALALPGPAARQDLPAVTALRLGPEAESALIAAVAAGTAHAPANLVPALGKASTDYARIYVDKCSTGLTETAVRKSCFYGDARSSTTIVLFGDSHAGQWFPALETIAAQRGWRLAVVVKSACTPASVLVNQPRLKRAYHECARWREEAWRHILSLDPAFVVMSGADDTTAVEMGPHPDEVWATGWRATFTALASPRSRQVLILDTPWPASDVPSCVARNRATVSVCGRPRADAVLAPARRRLVSAAATDAGVSVIDPVPWLCAQACPVIVGNVLAYYDHSHLSATYSALLAPVLAGHLPS